MGKTKKQRLGNSQRNNPLEKQILEDEYAQSSTRVKIRKRQDEDEEFVGNKLSKKILKQALEQQENLEDEIGPHSPKRKSAATHGKLLGEPDDNSESDDDFISNMEDYHEEIEINEDDAKALEIFMNKDPVKRATLADIIKEKLTEKETEMQTQFSDAGSLQQEDLERIKPIYLGVAEVLSRYRSGKLPKAFKTIPLFTEWEQILYLTEPDNWTAAAMYQATRIFASNLKDKMAQRFYNLVLLPRLRDDIEESKMLNFHLYQALKKSLFKPGAFFKGIILPLCESGDCTLREATIIGSVIAKFSIPVLHSSVAIIKISDMDYTGANSIFLRILLEKKYALPFRAIDAVVAHFLRFALDKRELPLLWHQCLLTFAQHYKNDISTEQQEGLLNLLVAHRHEHVTPEIRRELQNSTFRNVETRMPEAMQDDE